MSEGEGDVEGPWNKAPTFEVRAAQPAVGGGEGLGVVKLAKEEVEQVKAAATRLASDTSSDPVTGAMLGMDGGAQIQNDDDDEVAVEEDARPAGRTKARSRSKAR